MKAYVRNIGKFVFLIYDKAYSGDKGNTATL